MGGRDVVTSVAFHAGARWVPGVHLPLRSAAACHSQADRVAPSSRLTLGPRDCPSFHTDAAAYVRGCSYVSPGGRACAVARPHQTELASPAVLTRSRFLPKELEQLAKEQDKESEKQALLQEVENHRKQMLRWAGPQPVTRFREGAGLPGKREFHDFIGSFTHRLSVLSRSVILRGASRSFGVGGSEHSLLKHI